MRAVQELISAQETLSCACSAKHITGTGWGQPLSPGHSPGSWAAQEGSAHPSPEQHRPFSHTLLWLSLWCLLNSSAHLFPPLSRVWQDEQMLESTGVAGRDRLAQGLCSPVAVEPQLITLTRLLLVFTAAVSIDPNCS